MHVNTRRTRLSIEWCTVYMNDRVLVSGYLFFKCIIGMAGAASAFVGNEVDWRKSGLSCSVDHRRASSEASFCHARDSHITWDLGWFTEVAPPITHFSAPLLGGGELVLNCRVPDTVELCIERNYDLLCPRSEIILEIQLIVCVISDPFHKII